MMGTIPSHHTLSNQPSATQQQSPSTGQPNQHGPPQALHGCPPQHHAVGPVPCQRISHLLVDPYTPVTTGNYPSLPQN